MVFIISFALLLVVINVHAGILAFKKWGKWQYALPNWGIALFLFIIAIDKLHIL